MELFDNYKVVLFMFIHIFNCLNEIIFENFSIRMTEQNA